MQKIMCVNKWNKIQATLIKKFAFKMFHQYFRFQIHVYKYEKGIAPSHLYVVTNCMNHHQLVQSLFNHFVWLIWFPAPFSMLMQNKCLFDNTKIIKSISRMERTILGENFKVKPPNF